MSLDTLLYSAPGSWAGDGLVAPVWLGVNILLGLAAWRWSRVLFPHDGLLAAVAHTLVLAWATIVLVAIALGSTGLLGGTLLMIGVAGLALAALFARRGQAAPLAGPPLVEPGEGPWLCVWGLLLAFWIGHVVTGGLMKFPSDWDTLNYHLPMVVQWLHAHSLYAPDCMHWSNPGNNELIALWLAAPFSGDFLVSLNNLPAAVLLACSAVEVGRLLGLSRALAHLAAFAIVCNYVVFYQLVDNENDVAACALFFASVMYIFRHGANRSREPSGTLSGEPSETLPTPSLKHNEATGKLLSHIQTLQHIGVTAKPLSPCTRGERGWGEGGGPRNTASAPSACLLAATTIGLLAGVKFYALGYAALAAAAWVLLATATRGRRTGARTAIAALSGTIVLAGYWYLRNTLVTGSPLYPKGMFGSPDVIALIYPDIAHTSFLGNGRPELFELFVKAVWRMAGPCQVAAFLVAPLSLAWLFLPARGAPQSPITAARRTFAVLLVGCGLLLLLTPFAVEDEPGTLNQMYWQYCPVRYGLCFLCVASLALVVLVSSSLRHLRRMPLWLKTPFGYLPHGLLACSVAWQLAMTEARVASEWIDALLIAGNVGLFVLVVLLSGRLWPRITYMFRIGMLPLALLASIFTCDQQARRWHGGFSPHYDRTIAGCFTELERAAPLDGKICVLAFRCYPYFNPQRQFRVCQPLYMASADILAAYLDENDVAVISAQRVPRSFSWPCLVGFDQWILSPPARFSVIGVYSDRLVAQRRVGEQLRR